MHAAQHTYLVSSFCSDPCNVSACQERSDATVSEAHYEQRFCQEGAPWSELMDVYCWLVLEGERADTKKGHRLVLRTQQHAMASPDVCLPLIGRRWRELSDCRHATSRSILVLHLAVRAISTDTLRHRFASCMCSRSTLAPRFRFFNSLCALHTLMHALTCSTAQ